MKADGFARALGFAAATASSVDVLDNKVETSVGELDATLAEIQAKLQDTKDEIITEITTVQTDMTDELSLYKQEVSDNFRSYKVTMNQDIAYALERANTYTDNAMRDAYIVSSTAVNNIVKLTQAEYDALTEKDGATLYLIIS